MRIQATEEKGLRSIIRDGPPDTTAKLLDALRVVVGVCSTARDAEGDEHEEAAEAAEKAHVEGSGAGAHGDEREEAVEGDRAAPNLSWTCKAIPVRRNGGRVQSKTQE